MLSHLRFHRKGTSNPTSPVPDQQQSLSPLSNVESPQLLDSPSPLDGFPTSASSSSAPTLPPITRVTSDDSDSHERQEAAGLIPDSRSHQTQRLSYNGDVGFIGGVALRNYRRDVEAQQKASRADTGDKAGGGGVAYPDDASGRLRPTHLETNPDILRSSQFKQVPSFSTPTDLQASNAPNLGRRPAGAKLAQDTPLALSNIPSSVAVEPQKGKKGLPFLKNPMSTLLMRRRNNQNAPDLRPLPLNNKDEEPAYDPRIKGTRVHDFSAPRKSRNVYSGNPASSRSVSEIHLTSSNDNQPITLTTSVDAPVQTQRSAPQSVKTASRSQSSSHANDLSREPSEAKQSLTDEPQHSPSVEQSMAAVREVDTSSDSALPESTSSATTPERAERNPKISSSIRTARSRNISLSEMSISAIPKHMKSTSSRFSFDMVGAAKQEKLLEERHRQRELERQATDNDGFRDSRFDEFDEDAFDYDAMIDDDGLEERIPGVNADFDEEEIPESYDLDSELDPDNDQENFAGFVFQRSNPTSSLASPYSAGIVTTPRDVDGNVIGFAVTKDTPGTSTFPISPQVPAPDQEGVSDKRISGLGIQNAPAATDKHAQQDVREDDLYFDDGMAGFENEFAEDLAASPNADPPFDESIFDNNDTDQFGRPVPGAFAQAQSLRRADRDNSGKRESDITSRLSARSAVSQSTAHTSLSVDGQVDEKSTEHDAKSPGLEEEEQGESTQPATDGSTSVAAYQAALAAAAYRAAASGKFQRSASPPSYPVLDGEGATSEVPQDDIYGGFDDVDDDFNFDDDAIIAEANASALANDSDGWYGQEFGFYSAPSGSHSVTHNGSSSGIKEYEYANGGFFGLRTGGLNRSTSGRMISREPNLTPITERSEYSNRNSLMSLGYPPLSTSTPIVQSPGLAQLAMIADCGDDQMTLSALLRLRSKAWGGSQASLASSREGSPRSDRGDLSSSPWLSTSLGQTSQVNHGHGRMPSSYSNVSYDSDAASASGSPTVTMANTHFDQWPRPPIPEEDAVQMRMEADDPLNSTTHSCPLESESNLSLTYGHNEASIFQTTNTNSQGDGYTLNHSTRSSAKGHRHKGSADSVSYIKEEGSGETRWVMERRRTGETGQVEVLEREVVEGRQI